LELRGRILACPDKAMRVKPDIISGEKEMWKKKQNIRGFKMKILQDPLTIEDVITRNTTNVSCSKNYYYIEDDDVCKSLCDGLTVCPSSFSW